MLLTIEFMEIKGITFNSFYIKLYNKNEIKFL